MNFQECKALAEFAHFYLPLKPSNRYDKSGALYIDHPLRVTASVQAQGAPPYAQMAAVLHDTTEDTKLTPEMLLEFGVPEAAVNIVKLLDRDISAARFHELNQARDVGGTIKGHKWYMAFGPEGRDEFYYAEIRKNPFATMVKLADIGDNLQPWRLAYLPEETQDRLRDKYAKAIKLLTA